MEIIINNEKLEADYIGKGRYCKAYKADDIVYIFCKNCIAKQALSEMKNSIPFVPEIYSLGEQKIKRTNYIIYKTKYYEDLNFKYKTAWSYYKNLKESYDDIFGSNYNNQGYDFNCKVVHHAKLPRKLKKSLLSFIDYMSNYGYDIRLDIHRKNFGVDKNGNLIFRDIFYDPF